MTATHPQIEAPPAVGRSRPRSLLFALGGSTVTATLALWWLLAPAAHPLTDQLLLIHQLLSPTTAARVLLGCSVATLGVGLLALRVRGLRSIAAATGVLHAVALIIGYQSPSLIMLAGYTVALSVPIGLVVLTVQALRRYRGLRPVVLVLVAAAPVWGVVTGAMSPATLSHLAVLILTTFGPAVVAQLPAMVFLATAAAWIAVAWSRANATGHGGRVATFVREHRTVITLIAAACPLPYALLRLTWLSPWPLFSPGDLDPGLRLWGLLLGGAAIVGAVLTVGLVRPWGGVFPRWMPVVAGRPVPVAAAAVPGFAIAAIIATAGVSMLFSQFPGSSLSLADTLFTLIVFPFWLWAPMLALAVAGYVGHRRVAG